MNEGKQITKEQAEACMRADFRFEVRMFEGPSIYKFECGTVWKLSKVDIWEKSALTTLHALLHEDDYYEATIHADPNNTFERLFGSERELTFEEVGAALFRWGTVKVIFPNKNDALIKLVTDRGQLEIHESDDGGKTWCVGFIPDGLWRYTLYKEPTPPEPLTLEAIEALVKALEDRS